MNLYDKLIKSAKLSKKTTEPSRDELIYEMDKKRLEAEMDRKEMEKAFLVAEVVLVGTFIVTLLVRFLSSPI